MVHVVLTLKGESEIKASLTEDPPCRSIPEWTDSLIKQADQAATKLLGHEVLCSTVGALRLYRSNKPDTVWQRVNPLSPFGAYDR